MFTRVAALVVFGAAAAASAQDTPGLGGRWALNHERSQDLASRIKEVAGSETMAGGPSWSDNTWIPWGADFKEGERLSVREFLLGAVPAFDSVEIQPRADEVTTVHGAGASRIFRLSRASAGTSALSGETVKRQASFEGGTLVLESKGKEGLFRETFTLEPAGTLVYQLHLKQKRLKAPLEVRLVYDRAP
jgi:hypothetical protein